MILKQKIVFQTILSIIFLLFGGCSNKVKVQDNEYNRMPIIEKKSTELSILDRIRALDKPSDDEIKAIGDSLSQLDGNNIIGGIHFQMNETEYRAAFKEIMNDYNGSFYLICSKYPTSDEEIFNVDSIVPSFRKGKLCLLSFYGRMKEESKGDKWNNQIDMSFNALIEMFIRKYGKPHTIYYDYNERNKDGEFPIESINWTFEHRTITIDTQNKWNYLKSAPTPNTLHILDSKVAEVRGKEILEEVFEMARKELEEEQNNIENKRKIQHSL